MRMAAASSGTAAASAQPSHGASVHQYTRPSLSTMQISSIAGTTSAMVTKSSGSNALPRSLGGSGNAFIVASIASGSASSIRCRFRQ